MYLSQHREPLYDTWERRFRRVRFSTKSSIFTKKSFPYISEIVLRGIKRYWRTQPRGDGDDDKDEKIEKKQI